MRDCVTLKHDNYCAIKDHVGPKIHIFHVNISFSITKFIFPQPDFLLSRNICIPKNITLNLKGQAVNRDYHIASICTLFHLTCRITLDSDDFV